MATKYIPSGHGPTKWDFLVNDPKEPPILFSQCICGRESCFFSAVVYGAVNMELEPVVLVESYIR